MTMPHLPTLRQERKEADLERRVERIQRDHKLQRLRTRHSRRILAVISALLCVAIVPSFAQAGGIVGIAVTIAAWGSWWVLRISTRTVAELPERFLDERQRALRNRAFFYAYLILGWVVTALATVGLVAFVLVSENDAVTLTTTWDQALGLVLFLTLLISLLPSMVVAWSDAGEQSIERESGA
jgi:hypothetical protein